MKKRYLVILPTFLFALPAKAVCPVCVVAVGAGLGLSEYLGIDDSIAGLWIGGLLVAMAAWTINWLDGKKILTKQKSLRDIAVTLIYYVSVIWPLWGQDYLGQPGNTVWGLDKLGLGIVIGSLAFLLSTLWYGKIKAKNGGHAWFPFQKIVWPVGTLAILSAVFYFITR